MFGKEFPCEDFMLKRSGQESPHRDFMLKRLKKNLRVGISCGNGWKKIPREDFVLWKDERDNLKCTPVKGMETRLCFQSP
jgi:hypothetical protein